MNIIRYDMHAAIKDDDLLLSKTDELIKQLENIGKIFIDL